MRFVTQDKDVSLLMWEKTLMPESIMVDDEATKKKIFKKTGSKIEMTTYTLRDGFGDKLVLLSKNNDFRNLEGKRVQIILEVKRDEFKNLNKLSLAELSEVKK